MGKVCNMATIEDRESLSKTLKSLKSQYDLTTKEMTQRLNNPCKPSTLLARINYPSKACSYKLYIRIKEGIKILKEEKTKKQQFVEIKKNFEDELQELTKKYFKKVEIFFSQD